MSKKEKCAYYHFRQESVKTVTCGFLLYRRNRELHALSIIGLNWQDKKKQFTRFHLYGKLETDKKSFNSRHDVIKQ